MEKDKVKTSRTWEEVLAECEEEIRKGVPSAEKGVCPRCDGKPVEGDEGEDCFKCNGFGFVWFVAYQEDGKALKAIEKRLGFVGKASDLKDRTWSTS